MSFKLWLFNIKIFWVCYSKYKSIVFKLYTYFINTKIRLREKNNLFSWLLGILKNLLFFVLKLALLCIVIEYIDKRFNLSRLIFAYLSGNNPHSEIANTLKNSEIYLGIAGICATILSIYVATVSIVASITYAKLSRKIIYLLWSESSNKYFLSYSISLIFISLIISFINLTGYSISTIIYCLYFLCSLFWVYTFSMVIRNSFEYFSSNKLIYSSLLPDLQLSMKSLMISSYHGTMKNAQSFFREKIRDDIDNIEVLIYNQLISNNDRNGITILVQSDIRSCIDVLSYVLVNYGSVKNKIPLESKWFITKYKHKDWFLAEEYKIELALKTNTLLLPDEITDYQWFENRVFEILYIIFKEITVNKCESCIEHFLQKLADIIRVTAQWYSLDSLWNMLALFLQLYKPYIVEITISTDEIEAIMDKRIMISKLSVIDGFGHLIIETIMGLTNRVKAINIDTLLKRIDNVNWSDPNVIYRLGFTCEFLPILKMIQEKVSIEIKVEGKAVTPSWYIKSALMGELYSQLSFLPQNILNILNDYHLPLCDSYIKKTNYIGAFQLLNRGFEACDKLYSLIDIIGKTHNALKNFENPKLMPYKSNLDLEDICNKANKYRDALVNKICEISTMKFNLPNVGEIPDYLGQSYYLLANECLISIVNNNSERFSKLFDGYFMLALKLYDKWIQDVRLSGNEIGFARIRDIVSDLFSISGYALIYNGLEIFTAGDLVIKRWDSFISQLPNRDDWLKAIINLCLDKNDLFTNRRMIRYGWSNRIYGNLKSKEIITDEDLHPFRKGANTGNKILDTIKNHASSIGEFYYSPLDYFVALYLYGKDKPLLVSIDNYKISSLVEELNK